MTRAGIALTAALFLAGCDTAARTYVVNHSGAAIQLRHTNLALQNSPDKLTLIPDGRARSFGFHAVFRNGRVELESEGCAFSYAVPEMPWFRGFNEPALPVQIEPDMALYLKPRGAGPAPSAALPPVQRDGFPITPQKTCPGS